MLKLTPTHSRRVVSCPVQPRAYNWNCVSWNNFSGMKWTCWATGGWQCCLSLEVASSIPTWSTIICRFLYRFICISLCQGINIKHIYIYSFNISRFMWIYTRHTNIHTHKHTNIMHRFHIHPVLIRSCLMYLSWYDMVHNIELCIHESDFCLMYSIFVCRAKTAQKNLHGIKCIT